MCQLQLGQAMTNRDNIYKDSECINTKERQLSYIGWSKEVLATKEEVCKTKKSSSVTTNSPVIKSSNSFSKDWRRQFEMNRYNRDLNLRFKRKQTQVLFFPSLHPHLRTFSVGGCQERQDTRNGHLVVDGASRSAGFPLKMK